MFITNHALAGAVIGLAVPRRRRVVAAALGVVSHFALDALPHWGADDDDRKFLRVAVVDGLCGLATSALVARVVPPSKRVNVLAGVLGSCFPDVDKPARLVFNRSPFPSAVDEFHARIQRESPKRLRHELLVAAGLAITVTLLIQAD